MSEPEPVLPTPLEQAPAALGGGRPLWLKREDVHELGAFKWRGALPALRAYRERGAEAVVTASTGNHGAATAWAAERAGMRAVVYVPRVASETKLAVLERLGADLRQEGADLDESKELARAYAQARGPAVLRGRRRAALSSAATRRSGARSSSSSASARRGRSSRWGMGRF